MPKSTFPAKYQNLDEIRGFVTKAASLAGFSEKEIYAIQLAADEASANIIEHAYREDENGSIEVDCSWDGEELKVVLRDRGRAFNPAAVPEPNLVGGLSKRKIGGLGMYLMRRLMDEVVYCSSPENGNTMTMIKRKGASS